MARRRAPGAGSGVGVPDRDAVPDSRQRARQEAHGGIGTREHAEETHLLAVFAGLETGLNQHGSPGTNGADRTTVGWSLHGYAA